MTEQNNAKCNRKKCAYTFNSRIVRETGKLPKQCPKCKRYGTVEKIKK